MGPGFGNGMATAVQFAREGAKVLCVDRGGRAQRTAELITGEGGDAEAFRADVTVADEVQNMIAHCVERFGRVDILRLARPVHHYGSLMLTCAAPVWLRRHFQP